jgi:NAD(P)H dehydrogenase (quinone)
VKHALIISHPKAKSFTACIAEAYASACTALSHDIVVRDLYAMQFDPRLKAAELPFGKDFQPDPDVMFEREILTSCDVFALFYPLWLNAPPAMMKGYLDRVFGFGFAYGDGGHSYNPLLAGRKLVSFSSSGAPLSWVKQTGALAAVSALFDDYFANLCGMIALEHVHFGGVTPGASESFVQARMDDARKTVNRHFGSATCH